jgi:hypothetical protein
LVETTPSELYQPLGVPTPPKPASPWPKRLAWLAAGGPLAILLAAVGYAGLFGQADMGEPRSQAAIREVQPPTREAAAPAESFGRPREDAPPERTQATASQLEQESGVRVMRPGGASETPGSVVIRVPDADAIRLAPAPDRRLIERTRHGLLPKLGEDGARAWQVYARPMSPQATAATVRVAILIGGLGISNAATAEAISRLPPDISFAFAPYGSDLERQVQRARADGHEVFLQLPMEPFDYPDNDPGPHTLTTGASGSDNPERLRWLLGRFPGYVGVVNFMGGRLMADEASLAPILREVHERGLMIMDDGSSGRSLAPQLGTALRNPTVRADVVLDVTLRPDAIDRELARLEQIARTRGVAVASASALPLTLERVQRWVRAAEQRGVRLVPVSAAPGLRGQTTGAVR